MCNLIISVEMSVDPDPEKQRCQGILDATGAAGADMGGKVISSVLFYAHWKF